MARRRQCESASFNHTHPITPCTPGGPLDEGWWFLPIKTHSEQEIEAVFEQRGKLTIEEARRILEAGDSRFVESGVQRPPCCLITSTERSALMTSH